MIPFKEQEQFKAAQSLIELQLSKLLKSLSNCRRFCITSDNMPCVRLDFFFQKTIRCYCVQLSNRKSVYSNKERYLSKADSLERLIVNFLSRPNFLIDKVDMVEIGKLLNGYDIQLLV